MATGNRIVVDPEHVEGGDGTVGMALRLWSSKNGPVTYNDWQSVFFQLIKAGFEDAEASEVPLHPEGAILAPADFNRRRQNRISRMYRNIQTEIHGADFGERAIEAQRASLPKSKPAPKRALAAGWRPALGEATHQADQGAARDETVAQQTVGCLTADGLQSQAVVASDSAAGAAGVQVPTFAIDTPGQVAVPTGHSVDVLWLDEQAQLALQEYAVSYTELTEDMDDRMALVTEVLSHMEGATQQGLAFVVKVENTVKEYRDYYGELVAVDPENAKIPLQLWATERLTQLSSSDFEEYEDLKRHVYALGKIGERPIEGCRRLAQNMWETSDYGTPA